MIGFQSAEMTPKEEYEHAEHGGECAELRHCGHEPRHRGGSALVDVGRPHVERHRRHLEGETHQHEAQSGQEETIGQHDVLGQEVGDLGQVGGTGGAVGKCNAVDEDGRGEAAEDEVLERRLTRGGEVVVERREHIEGDGEDLQTQKDDDQVVGRAHQHGARSRDQSQDMEFRSGDALTGEIAIGDQRREEHGGRHHHGNERAEAIHHDGMGDVGVRPMGPHIGPLPYGDAERTAGNDHAADGADPHPQVAADQ